MQDDVVRSIKAEMLRRAATEFRRKAEAGDDPQLHILGACMLEQRADRIAAGEDDHSDIPVDIGVAPNGGSRGGPRDDRPSSEQSAPKAG